MCPQSERAAVPNLKLRLAALTLRTEHHLPHAIDGNPDQRIARIRGKQSRQEKLRVTLRQNSRRRTLPLRIRCGLRVVRAYIQHEIRKWPKIQTTRHCSRAQIQKIDGAVAELRRRGRVAIP